MSSKAEVVGWFRRLQDERLEVYLKVESVPGVRPRKIRASGPQDEMNELADWFEQKTGLRVSAPWRTVKPSVIPGQMHWELTMGEAVHIPDDPVTPGAEFFDKLSSDATLGEHG